MFYASFKLCLNDIWACQKTIVALMLQTNLRNNNAQIFISATTPGKSLIDTGVIDNFIIIAFSRNMDRY